jgi:hypothetical protein
VASRTSLAVSLSDGVAIPPLPSEPLALLEQDHHRGGAVDAVLI